MFLFLSCTLVVSSSVIDWKTLRHQSGVKCNEFSSHGSVSRFIPGSPVSCLGRPSVSDCGERALVIYRPHVLSITFPVWSGKPKPTVTPTTSRVFARRFRRNRTNEHPTGFESSECPFSFTTTAVTVECEF